MACCGDEDSPVIKPEGHGVTDKILGTSLQSKFGVNFLHRDLVDIESCEKTQLKYRICP